MIESAYSVKPHPLSIVIFSKDRAAQLDLCLKSIHKNFSNLSEHWNIYIIYTSSSKDFEDSYRQLIKEWYSKPNAIYFFPENKYKGFKKTPNPDYLRKGPPMSTLGLPNGPQGTTTAT